MSDVIQQVDITLNGAPVRECSYTTELNGSVEWSATVAASMVDLETLSPSDTFTLSVSVTDSDGGSVSWTSPTLVCTESEEYSGRDGEHVTLHGTDQASWLLTASGYSNSTIHDTMAQVLAATVAGLAGSTVAMVGGPVNWRVEDFDVIGDSQVGEFLKRLCRDGGWSFRPGASSGLEVFDAEYTPASPATLRWESWRRSRRNSQRYSQLIMQLQRKYKGQYVFPVDSQAEEMQTGDLSPGLAISTLSATDLTTGGGIEYAAFFDGPSGGGALCGYILLDPTGPSASATSSNPALSVVFKVKAPVPPVTSVNGNLVITGRPPSDYTYDPPATVQTTPTAGARSKVLKMESTLWDTTAFMESRKAAILAAANSGCDVIEFSGVRFDPRFNAGDALLPSGLPPCQIHSASWSYSSGRVSQSLVTHVL